MRKHKALMEAIRNKSTEPCLTEEQNVKPGDCICDLHALKEWMDSGSPRTRMLRRESER
jgi:hypothetical protein